MWGGGGGPDHQKPGAPDHQSRAPDPKVTPLPLRPLHSVNNGLQLWISEEIFPILLTSCWEVYFEFQVNVPNVSC